MDIAGLTWDLDGVAPAAGRIGATTRASLTGFARGAVSVLGAIGLAPTSAFTGLAVAAAEAVLVAPGFIGTATPASSELSSCASMRNCSLSLPTMATRMKVIQMGSAAFAPVSFSPKDWRLS